MAVYNGREVQILQVIPAQGNLPTTEDVQIVDKQGQHFTVALGKLQLTQEEKDNLLKQHKTRYENVNTVSDKDLQELRDSQDPKKNEERMKAAEAPKDVTIHAQKAQVNSVPSQRTEPLPVTKAPVKK